MGNLASYRKQIDSETGKKKAKGVHDIFVAYLNQQRDYRRLWLATSAFPRGIHYTVLDSDDNLITLKLPQGQKRCKINKIGAWKSKMLARITRVRPEYEVIPSGEFNLKSLDAKQAGTAYLQHVTYNVNKWPKLRYKITSHTIDFGLCYVYIRDVEDPRNLHAVTQKDEFDEENIDPETMQPKVDFTPVVDIIWEVLMPQQVLHDLSPSSLDTKYDLVLAFHRDLTYFNLTYDKEIQPDTNFQNNANYDLHLLSRMNMGNIVNEGATEFIYLRKPNNKDKDGIVLITTLNEVLYKGPWRYKHMLNYPLVEFFWGEPPPGEYYPQTPIEDQIPINQDINEAHSITQENMANMGHLKWMNPIGSGVETINDLSGQIVNYTPGKEPRQSEVTPLPNYLVNRPAQLEGELEDIQHYHGVSKGEGTSQPRSAVGLDRLEEQDQEPQIITDDMLEAGYTELGLKTLQIAAEKATTPQLIKYIGEGRPRKIENFRGEMLDPDSKVSVRMVDAYMRNKGAAQRIIMELANSQLIGRDKFGQLDPVRIQRMLQFAIPEILYDKEDRQREIAYEENEQMFQGEEVFPKEWEYQVIHIDVVEEMLNSKEFSLKSKEEPNLEERVVKHWTGHQKILMDAFKGIAGSPTEGASPNAGESPQRVET